MNSPARIIYWSLVVLVVITTVIYFVNESLFISLVREDGLIENISALTMLLTSVLLLMKFFKARRGKPWAWKFVKLILAAGLFFGFGEEISWGQRIFTIESSEFFLENNRQQETNLHNLEVGGVNLNKLIFTNLFSLVFGLYFLFSQLVYRKVNSLHKLVDKLGIPIPTTPQTLILLGLTVPITLISYDRKWELWECLFTVVLLMVFVHPYNPEENLLD